jgi:hypothetical protein
MIQGMNESRIAANPPKKCNVRERWQKTEEDIRGTRDY